MERMWDRDARRRAQSVTGWRRWFRGSPLPLILTGTGQVFILVGSPQLWPFSVPLVTVCVAATIATVLARRSRARESDDRHE